MECCALDQNLLFLYHGIHTKYKFYNFPPHFGQLWWNSWVLEKTIPFLPLLSGKSQFMYASWACRPLESLWTWPLPCETKSLANSIAVSEKHAHWRGNEQYRVLQQHAKKWKKFSLFILRHRNYLNADNSQIPSALTPAHSQRKWGLGIGSLQLIFVQFLGVKSSELILLMCRTSLLVLLPWQNYRLKGKLFFYLDYKRIVELGTPKSDKEECENDSLPS